MSGANSSKRGPGRPARTSAPFVIRGVVPESHPHYERLKALGSAGAARAVLQMLANPLGNTANNHALAATDAQSSSKSLDLNLLPSPANSIQVGDQASAQTMLLDSDLSDLLSFTGGGG